MKWLIVLCILMIAGYSFAIKVGDQPMLPGGISVGYNIGISNGGGSLTYWTTSNTDYWDVDNTALWDTTTDTEVP
jgi:hypothetical protein